MKNYDELTNNLLERRDRYVVDQKKKRKRIMRAAMSFCCLCMVTLLGFGVWQGGVFDIALSEPIEDDNVHISGNENNSNNSFSDDMVTNKNNSNTQSNDESASVSTSDNPYGDPIASDDICDILGMVVIDGETYLQFETDAELYTLDVCLGDTGNFIGTYQTHLNDIPSKLYRTKEDVNVLIVKLENGGIVVLKKVKL